MHKKRIIITCGDPAGCGPLVSLRAIADLARDGHDFFLVGDAKIFSRFPLYARLRNKFTTVDVATSGIEKIKAGRPDLLSGKASLSYLKHALAIMPHIGARRLVTAPLSKEAAALCLPGFCGHTEYLASHYKVKRFEMMMVSSRLNVVLYSRHIPFARVSAAVNQKAILNTLATVYTALRNTFGIKRPRIVCASLNPHAGVDTFLGKEEKIILRAIDKFPEKIYGPYPSDTVFTKDNLSKYNCIICAYHDQGMIPFKLLSFHDGVNLTLGLPIVRTSPAHGTAFDLMGKRNRILHTPMRAAIELAARLNPSGRK